jgi:hypothetical protein
MCFAYITKVTKWARGISKLALPKGNRVGKAPCIIYKAVYLLIKVVSTVEISIPYYKPF